MPRNHKLNDQARAFVVQSLATWQKPAAVAKALRVEFGLEVTAQAVEAYDPTKRAGASLAARWRVLFHETRSSFIQDLIQIGISHKAFRLRVLDRLFERAEAQGNIALAADLLKQAAQEMGDAFTNRRELRTPDGEPFRVIIAGRDAEL